MVLRGGGGREDVCEEFECDLTSVGVSENALCDRGISATGTGPEW